MGILDDYLEARGDELDPELADSARTFNARIQVCRRIYKEDFAGTTAGNPGEFQACMVLLKMWQDDERAEREQLAAATWGQEEETHGE
jgi:hypothetical protein